MANVQVIQRHAHLAGAVKLEFVNGREGKIAKAVLTAISNTRRGSGDAREEESTAIQWTVWGKQAENAAEYLGKGSHVNIVGRLRNNNYEKDGEEVYALAFTAEEVDYLDSRADSEALTLPHLSVTDGRPIVLIDGARRWRGLASQPRRRDNFIGNLQDLMAIARRRFDVCVIDTPARPGVRLLAALACADLVLVPSPLDPASIGHVGYLFWHARCGIYKVQASFNPRLQVLGLLPTMVHTEGGCQDDRPHIARVEAISSIDPRRSTAPVERPVRPPTARESAARGDERLRRSLCLWAELDSHTVEVVTDAAPVEDGKIFVRAGHGQQVQSVDAASLRLLRISGDRADRSTV